ncbi:MAG: carboxypeptidase regulatory-like domain-containing protein, partial [Acidobacteriota bacterium]|nr:carboxypeptidase regulatory-like domain-containing protein [Acidobacteriota bacterium]
MSGCCAALFVCLCFFSAAPNAQAQVLYGSVVGTVTDPSGAIIPGAAVTLAGTATGVERSATADEGGRYSFVNVLPGNYTLKITAKGFRSFAATGFDVSPNTVQRVDAKLEVGQISEQVTVEATAAALQTEKSDTHSEINSKSIESMPIGGYRNYETLINLVPGATPASLQNSITDTPGRALRTNINGGNANTNITRIDGATSVNVWLPHHVGYVTPEEDIAVVNVTTGAADAEQGMAGSSAITVVTKSGTNELHGSAYEFHNDQHLNSRAFFQAPGTDKPLAIYNNFGATLGGAIKKNKLFYFVSYDGTRQRQSSPGFYTVPTTAFKGGDFSSLSTVIYDPNTGNPDGTGRTPFAGNVIPGNRISPIAQKIQSYYPTANFGNGALTNNFFAAGGHSL